VNYPYRLAFSLEKGYGRRTYNPRSKGWEDGFSNVRGIKDAEGKWVGKPSPRWHDYATLREMNGLPPMSTAKVRAVLKKAGLIAAKYHRSGMVKGWGDWSPGYKVEYDDYGRVTVRYQPGRWYDGGTTEYASYFEALSKAGLPINREDNGALWL
jgi:hypothetical protein